MRPSPAALLDRLKRRRTRRAFAVAGLRRLAATDPAAYDTLADTGDLDPVLVELVDIMGPAVADLEADTP